VYQYAPADQLQQPTAAVMVLPVLAEVVVEVVDACGEQRDLYLWRPGVAVVELVLGDDAGLCRVDLVGHVFPSLLG
jgi:hypothetical protein